MNKEMNHDDTDAHLVQQQFMERFNDLRRFDKYSDCSFKVEGQIVNGHKLILMAASPVFEAMFYGPLAETRVVKIDDISYGTFGKMLNFVYKGKLDEHLSIPEHLELYYCAQKYIIDGLGKTILKSLSENTRKNNVLGILKMSYEMHLDDIVYSCAYVLQQWLTEAHFNFGNLILQNTHHQLQPKLLSFLVSETISNKYYIFPCSIQCFVRAWCLVECSLRGLEPMHENLRTLLQECDLPDGTTDMFLYQNYAYSQGVQHTTLLQRTYHKAARPLIIGTENHTKVTFWADQFVTIAGFSINSRLFTSNQRVQLNLTYKEEVSLQLRSGEEEHLFLEKKTTIHDVEYNDSFTIDLTTPVVMFPGTQYTLILKWDSSSVDCEYPRSVFANFAKHKGIRVNFEEDGPFLQGSIVNGLICETPK